MKGGSVAHPADDLEEALRQRGRPLLEQRHVGVHRQQTQLPVLLSALKALDQTQREERSEQALETKARRWEPLWGSEHTLRQQSQEAVGDVRLHLVSDQQEDCVHCPDEPGVVRGICTLVYRKINTFRSVTLFLRDPMACYFMDIYIYIYIYI